MCAPTALMAIPGMILSAAGQSSAANSKAAVAERNAQASEMNAIARRQQGASEADQKEDANSSQRATAKVAAAASGVRQGGSVSRVIDQAAARDHYIDEQMIIWNRETQANAEENNARAKRAEADAERQAGRIGALTTFVTGAGKVATQIA